MKTNLLLVGAFALLVGCTATAKTNEYVVIAGKSVVEDSLWNQVAQALVEKHGAASLSYNESPEELLPQLRELRPRYVAIVEKPENLGRDYVIALNQMSRRVDNDIYADFLWGIITGYDAAAAMKMVDNPVYMPDPSIIDRIEEPMIEAKMMPEKESTELTRRFPAPKLRVIATCANVADNPTARMQPTLRTV